MLVLEKRIKMTPEEKYARLNPWRLFFVVALPGMISMFAMSIYSVIEGAFIGQTLGEGAFAAINIAFPLVFINFSLADLVGVGASVPISIALGKKDNETANNVFSCSLIMIVCAAFFTGIVMFFAAAPLCRMMGATDELLYTSMRYLRTFAVCGPVTTLFFAMDNYLRISGYVKSSMAINIGQNLLTVALLALFLFGFKTDVVGSAFAICISMCAAAAVALIPFIRKKTILRFARPRFHLSMFKEIFACGSPVFLSNIAGRVTSILMNISLMRIGLAVLGEGGGTTAVAAYGVLMYASDLCWPLIFGISDSLSPSIGYNWGAKNYGRVKRIVGCGYIGTATVGLISTALLFFGAPVVARIFVSAEDAVLLSLSEHGIRLFCFAYLFRWFGVMTQSFFSAIEKPVLATVMSVSIALVFPVLCLGALWSLGLDGLWLNFVGTNVLAAILGAILLVYILRMIKRREETERLAAALDED